MPFKKTSSDTPRDSRPSDVRGSETTAKEATERQLRETSKTQQLQSSGDFPTNPTTEHRYGSDIGTGVYDSGKENAARTSYTISEADYRRTAPDSGKGIHAQQYHGRENRSIPLGATTVVHTVPAVSQDVDTTMRTRATEPEMRPGGQIERGDVYPDTSLEERTQSERVPGEPRLHERDVQRERGMAQSSGQEKSQEKAHTRKGSKGSLGGLFSRHRDTTASKDTDDPETRTGSKAGGRGKIGKEAEEQERLARDPESTRASQGGSGDPGTEYNEGQQSEADPKREAKPAKGKPTMMDKIVGNTEVAIGKSTKNASMLAKGEAKAAGLSRN